MSNKSNKSASKAASATAVVAPVAVLEAPAVIVIPTHGARTTASKAANPMPKSTVANPVQAAWGLFGELAQRPGGVTRKDAVAAAMAAGIAYYTARTQYQLFSVELRKQNSPEAVAARELASAKANGTA